MMIEVAYMTFILKYSHGMGRIIIYIHDPLLLSLLLVKGITSAQLGTITTTTTTTGTTTKVTLGRRGGGQQCRGGCVEGAEAARRVLGYFQVTWRVRLWSDLARRARLHL